MRSVLGKASLEGKASFQYTGVSEESVTSTGESVDRRFQRVVLVEGKCIFSDHFPGVGPRCRSLKEARNMQYGTTTSPIFHVHLGSVGVSRMEGFLYQDLFGTGCRFNEIHLLYLEAFVARVPYYSCLAEVGSLIFRLYNTVRPCSFGRTCSADCTRTRLPRRFDPASSSRMAGLKIADRPES